MGRKFRIGLVIGVIFALFSNSVLACCTLTQGYWKNHPEDWPTDSLTLGLVTYGKEDLLAILDQPVEGDDLVSLAHQLIAAKLNVANNPPGSIPSAANTAITNADGLIGSLEVPPIGGGYLEPSLTSGLITALTDFNEGDLPGAPHCTEGPIGPVPEPMSIGLLGIGLAGLVGFARLSKD